MIQSISFLLVFSLVAVAAFVIIYNSLIFRKNAIDQSLGGIQAYIKKRADLIPAVVATISEFAQHEKNLLTEITQLRTDAMKPELTSEEQIRNADQLSTSVKQLLVNVEQYPDLKSSENFRQLQHSLAEIEDQLSAARRAYNAAIVFYNNGVEMIPHNIVAAMMGLKKKAVFEAPAQDQKALDINGLFQGGKHNT